MELLVLQHQRRRRVYLCICGCVLQDVMEICKRTFEGVVFGLPPPRSFSRVVCCVILNLRLYKIHMQFQVNVKTN